jgi:hypothetical protein
MYGPLDGDWQLGESFGRVESRESATTRLLFMSSLTSGGPSRLVVSRSRSAGGIKLDRRAVGNDACLQRGTRTLAGDNDKTQRLRIDPAARFPLR